VSLPPYDFFEIDSYEKYLSALENSTTDLFWMESKYIELNDNFDSIIHSLNLDNKKINYAFKHQHDDIIKYNGLFLCSKENPLSLEEVRHRNIEDPKFYDVVASTTKPYEIFEVDSYDQYLHALKTSKTRMFWITSRHIEIVKEFDFGMCFSHIRKNDVGYKKKTNAFMNIVNGNACYDGVFLCSKTAPLTKKEVETRNLDANKIIKWETVASKKLPYDIVFISYNEEAAEKNYLNLKEKFPRIKHVCGVKGIHNAHIAAANLVDTNMFWVIDADAVILDSFNFDLIGKSKGSVTTHLPAMLRLVFRNWDTSFT
jgi:hypothetical protein